MPNLISNTSPIQYLYQTELLDLLPMLYGEVILPQAVVNELAEGGRLGVSLPDITVLPWVNIRQPRDLLILSPVADILGAGEQEAIALAVEIPDSLVILDDGLARRYAKTLGVQFTGTLGVILKGKQSGYLSEIMPVLDRLDSLGFRLDSSTRASVLRLAGE
ncbi:DUF3368 domain-containing protein [Floridanema aerugineum]|uniref:DUF3368 domain-containing protein n=1 Tax=Floridaenema aerugineum BLCC-F46 TaxID=3153654 RepID=A0ABV4X0J2_9CYAN